MFVNARQVAEKFGVSVTSIYNWVDKGVLKPSKITPTGRKMFDSNEVDKLYEGMNQQNEECDANAEH